MDAPDARPKTWILSVAEPDEERELEVDRAEKSTEHRTEDEDGKAQQPGRSDKLAHDRDLFEILRSRRKELADKAGVPPYVIFSDRTLVEMATYFPLSLESLKNINGVGAVKLQRYGGLWRSDTILFDVYGVL